MKRSFQMRAFLHVWALPLWIACSFTSDMAFAQLQVTRMQAACPEDGAACSGAVVIGAHRDFEVVKDQPYQAQAITEIKQALADGSHTDQTAMSSLARDSEGRTAQVQKLGNGTTVTTIFDPVTKTHIDFTSDTKVAHVITLPTGANLAVRGFSGTVAVPASGAGGALFLQSHAAQKLNATTESLGTKIIEGIQVTGTQRTSMIPAGTIGNDRDITISDEAWHSAELKLDLLTIHNDPRFGQTTYSLTNLQRGEPDASLFQVPPDYKVEETPMPAVLPR